MRHISGSGTGVFVLALTGTVAACEDPSGVPLHLHAESVVRSEVRPDDPNGEALWKFEPGDVVETWGSLRFLLHFTREGPNAVPSLDADSDGSPDAVQDLAALYEEVLDFYTVSLGYQVPLRDGFSDDNGGDDRYDVYLLDFSLASDGSFRPDECEDDSLERCTGYIVQENDFAGYNYPSASYANRLLASHEFFHFVQAGYDRTQGVVVAEGTAVWASHEFEPALLDVAGFSSAFLSEPDRALNVPPPGPVPAYAYGAGIFFQFLDEKYGPGVVRAIWENVVDDDATMASDWLVDALPVALASVGTDFSDAYFEFARWNLYTGTRADPAESYAEGGGYAEVAMEPVEAPLVDDALRVYQASAQYWRAVPGPRAEMTAALVVNEEGAAELEDLRLLLAVLAGGAVIETREIDLVSGTETLATTGASGFVAIVVNTAVEGPSRRPALCVGSVDEVSACRTAVLDAVAPGGDGGVRDGGGPDVEPPPPACACQQIPTGPCPLIAVAAGVLLRRRSRPTWRSRGR